MFDLNSATPAVPLAILNNPAPNAGDYFGASVAIDGDLVVAGSTYDSTGASFTGSAYVYNLASATPELPAITLNNPLPGYTDFFGASLAMAGTRLVVGSSNDESGAFRAGRAYVYELAGPTPAVPVITIENPTPAAEDGFGNSAALSGTRLIVGAFRDDTAGTNAGSACVYELAGATPAVPLATLQQPDPASGDQSGGSVAVSGTWMVVGARNDGTATAAVGKVFVYDLGSPTPTIPAYTLNNPNPSANDYFGCSVAISGNKVVAGAYAEDVGANNAGSAYVFDLSSGTPTVPVLALHNPEPGSEDSFGWSVAISGNRVVIGAYRDDAGANDSGSAYVFDLAADSPAMPAATLRNPGPLAGDFFGGSVAISGTRVVIGAYSDDTGASSAGSAYVYNLNSDTPTEPATTLNNPGPAANDGFGYAVAISGTRVLVGAPYDNTGNNQSGSSYAYDLAGGSPTVPTATLVNPAPGFTDWFGTAVGISGTRAVVGAPRDDTGASNAGSAYVYDLAGGTPTVPVGSLNNPGPASDDNFGQSVAIDGTLVAVGAPNDDTLMPEKGTTYIYASASAEFARPADGTMTLAPASPVDAGASLTIGFAEWTDASLPLSYQVSVDNVVVSPAGPATSRAITAPATPGLHLLKGRIIDAQGNATEVTQAFTVLTEQESWRRQYFGITTNSGNAADTADVDGDGHDNLFEFTAGLLPNDSHSRFSVKVELVSGFTEILFGPVVAGRTYVVKSSSDAGQTPWTPLGSSFAIDDGNLRKVIDSEARATRRFYRVEITRP